MTEASRVRPFSCGSQAGDWAESNCARCTKEYDSETNEYHCDIEQAIDKAWVDDGYVSAEIAVRMGITEETKGDYVWPCAEVDWSSKWKAEWNRRHGVAEAEVKL